MLNSLKNNDGDFSKLKQWEQRSYKHYNIEKIHSILLKSSYEEQINIIRNHILNSTFEKLGAGPFDIYIVAYVSENMDTGRESFVEYCLNNRLVGTPNSANAIYQVEKSDGVFLRILNDDGTVMDWEFMYKLVNC